MGLFKSKNRKRLLFKGIILQRYLFRKKVLTVNNKSEKPIVLILRKF